MSVYLFIHSFTAKESKAERSLRIEIMINEPQEPKHNFHRMFLFVCSIKWDDLSSKNSDES